MKVKEIISGTRWIPNENGVAETPKFSIFLPTFRRAKSGHLERAIQSVLSQSFRDLELIIIDDASTDGSHEIIREFMKTDRRVHMLHHPVNVGLPAIGCYEAYLKSRGEYVGFCFDDTEMARDALKETNEFLEKTKAKVAYGYITIDEPTSSGKVIKHEFGRLETSQQTLLETNYIPNLGVVLHRDVPKEAGFLDPHFAVARVCDWDYWRRLSMKYELRRMDVYMGAEYGLVTGNSLGLTYPISSHLNSEWGAISRDELLKPGAFEEYDVQAAPSLSYPSYQALQDLHQFYANKFWYRPFNSSGNDSAPKKYGRIFVIGSGISASTSIPFQALTHEYFRLCSNFLEPSELALAQSVVMSRDILHPWAHVYIETAKALRVPMYYYFDDNFEVLRPMIEHYHDYTAENLRKRLEDFSGIFVPNQELADYCIDRELHENVVITPPTIGNRRWLDRRMLSAKRDGLVRLCFMGGGHRTKHFEDAVLPAINRLAESREVEIVLVGKHQIPPESWKNVVVHQVPFEISYDLTIGRLINEEIDILIHAGSSSLGNRYKTPNALINAWEFGAVPIVAKQFPYMKVEDKGIGFVAEHRDAESWYEKLLSALDPMRSQKVKENLSAFIHSEYSGQTTRANMDELLKHQMPIGFATIDLRNKWYVQKLSRDVNHRNMEISPLIPSFACNGFAKLKGKSTIHYDVVSEEDGLSGLNFRVGTFASAPKGVLEVGIRDSKGKSLAVQEFDLSQIRDNQVVRFDFDPLSKSAGRSYRVAFTYYPIGNGKLAIYEVNQCEKGFVRLLRKTGILRTGNTLACNLLYARHAA